MKTILRNPNQIKDDRLEHPRRNNTTTGRYNKKNIYLDEYNTIESNRRINTVIYLHYLLADDRGVLVDTRRTARPTRRNFRVRCWSGRTQSARCFRPNVTVRKHRRRRHRPAGLTSVLLFRTVFSHMGRKVPKSYGKGPVDGDSISEFTSF